MRAAGVEKPGLTMLRGGGGREREREREQQKEDTYFRSPAKNEGYSFMFVAPVLKKKKKDFEDASYPPGCRQF